MFMNKKLISNAWEEMLRANDWDAIENWWHYWFNTQAQSAEELAPLRALLTALREVVPLVSVENGMERFERHIRPTDGENEWQGRESLKGAAAILYLGELEAAAEGEPVSASEMWSQHRDIVTNHLKQFLNVPEKTKGAEELSRVAHAEEALKFLASIDMVVKMTGYGLADEAEQTWLREVIAEAAHPAFEAGRHSQAAWGKSFEQFALTGRNLSRGAKLGADMRRAQTSPKTADVLKEMQRHIDTGHSISRAATLAANEGIGPSASANRKLWSRHK